MTKKEIVKAISQDVGLPKSKTREIVQKTFDAIIDALVNEGRIELRNFGIFEVKKRAARPGRNPRTGDEILVPERFVVNFKAGKVMEDRVKRLQAKSVSEAIAEAIELEQQGKSEANSHEANSHEAKPSEPKPHQPKPHEPKPHSASQDSAKIEF